MAYHQDPYDNSIVIDGFEKGIADSPFQGISDMRNVNTVTVPGEASVTFATATRMLGPNLGPISVTSADAGTDIITFTSTSTLVNGQAVTFSGGSLPTGIVAGTVYWVNVLSSTTAKLWTDYANTSFLDITATGTGTFSTVNLAQPKYLISQAKALTSTVYWLLDASGRVWSTLIYGVFNYTGNKVPGGNYTAGNGIVYYEASDGTGYIFIIHNGSIDYTSASTVSWLYQWDPTTGSAAGYSATPTSVLKSSATAANIHEALLGPDNKVYFCDTTYIDRFYEANPATAFNPTTPATYVWDQTSLIPAGDKATCLAWLGLNLLIGGLRNIIYPWNTIDTHTSYPIFLPESNAIKLITVNSNTYIFGGTRGRIYITNGSSAQLYKKIPDHISGSVEPYFTWGGVASARNRLYFSFTSRTNDATLITNYGGVWSIDLDTEAIQLAHKLSFGTYAGLSTAMVALNNPTQPITSGSGLYFAWDDGNSNYGIDGTGSAPYTNSEASIDSDLIPIGTYDKPRDFTRIEYRLTKPMVSGESVTIKYRLDFSQSYTTIFTDSTAGNFSASNPVNFKNAQWVQFQIILNSTVTNPSYTRLKEMRILGLVQ